MAATPAILAAVLLTLIAAAPTGSEAAVGRALVDAAEPAQLADLLIANLPAPVDDKARYAAELRLAEAGPVVIEVAAQ